MHPSLHARAPLSLEAIFSRIMAREELADAMATHYVGGGAQEGYKVARRPSARSGGLARFEMPVPSHPRHATAAVFFGFPRHSTALKVEASIWFHVDRPARADL